MTFPNLVSLRNGSQPALPRSSHLTRIAIKIEGAEPCGPFVNSGGSSSVKTWAEILPLLPVCIHQELRDLTGARQRLLCPSGAWLICFSLKKGRPQMHFRLDISVCFLPRKAQLKVLRYSTPYFQGSLIRSLGPNHKHGKLPNCQGQQSKGCIKGEFQWNTAWFLNSYQMSSRRLKLLQ